MTCARRALLVRIVAPDAGCTSGRGGQLTFETSDGEGTTFFVRLPVDGEAIQARMRKEHKGPDVKGLS